MPELPADPPAWAAVSVGLYVAWALLARWFGPSVDERLLPRVPAPAIGLATLVAELAYFVGIPYLTVIYGVLDLRTVGLSGGDPVVWLPLAAAVALAAWSMLALSWRRWADTGPAPALHAGPATGAGGEASRSLAVAVTQQCHLALYRGVIALAAGTYTGVFAGLGLLALERLAGTVIRRRWPGDRTAEGEIVLAATLVVTSLLFLATNSLVACLLTHFAVQLGMAWVAGRGAARSAAAVE